MTESVFPVATVLDRTASGDDARTVLVVGAGPVGLAAAGELARQGARVRLVDALPAPTAESRAIVVHPRTQEHLQAMGALDRVVARAPTDALVDPVGEIARHYGLGAHGYTLIRPDGYLACTSHTLNTRALHDHLDTLHGAAPRPTKTPQDTATAAAP